MTIRTRHYSQSQPFDTTTERTCGSHCTPRRTEAERSTLRPTTKLIRMIDGIRVAYSCEDSVTECDVGALIAGLAERARAVLADAASLGIGTNNPKETPQS